jgi:hypothetical protein
MAELTVVPGVADKQIMGFTVAGEAQQAILAQVAQAELETMAVQVQMGRLELGARLVVGQAALVDLVAGLVAGLEYWVKAAMGLAELQHQILGGAQGVAALEAVHLQPALADYMAAVLRAILAAQTLVETALFA